MKNKGALIVIPLIGAAGLALLLSREKGEGAEYICQYCGERFDNIIDLTQHMWAVHGIEPLPAAASVEIRIVPDSGRLMTGAVPVSMDEGGSGTVIADVTNASVRGSQAWAASFDIGCSITSSDFQKIVSPTSWKTVDFAADEKKSVSFAFTVPFGTVPVGNAKFEARAIVGVYRVGTRPPTAPIAGADKTFTILEVPITYKALVIL